VEQELYKGSTTTICYPKTGIEITLVCIAVPQHNQAPSKQKKNPRQCSDSDIRQGILSV